MDASGEVIPCVTLLFLAVTLQAVSGLPMLVSPRPLLTRSFLQLHGAQFTGRISDALPFCPRTQTFILGGDFLLALP
jgi:hypothetical protein